MKFQDLPVVNLTIPGYERLFALPVGWPRWRESDGRCFALTFTDRHGGFYTSLSGVAKEEIPESAL
jgi:hypothetical protein